MEDIHMHTESLTALFNWVEQHTLALPELQRKSVWPGGKVPRLLKSVYEGYPFGIMLIWQPKAGESIRCRPFKFQEMAKGQPEFDASRPAQYYLIDGQQRLTSFYRALKATDPKVRLEVAFNLETQEFVLPDAPLKKQINTDGSKWHYLHELSAFGVAQWAELAKKHPTLDIDNIQRRVAKLAPNEIKISYFLIDQRSYYEATEIFERINLGLPVSKTQIAVGKLSERYRGIVEELEDYLSEQRKRHSTSFDLDLITLAFTAVVTHYASIDKLEKNFIKRQENPPTEETIKQDLERTKEAVAKAFRFIEEHLHIDTFRYIGSERAFICLVYLFAHRRKELNEAKLAYWFAWALLVQYHSRQETFFRDLRLFRETKVGLEDALLENLRKHESWQRELDDWKRDDEPTNRNNIIFKFMYSAMRSKGAKDFKRDHLIKTVYVGETSEEDDEELQDATHSADPFRLHEHHIYPKARLETFEVPSEEINDIANLTFILEKTNIEIGDAEISYLQGLSNGLREAHLIDSKRRYKEGIDGFHQLIKDRRRLIYKALKEYMEDLKSKAES
jgi:hypothetical protein